MRASNFINGNGNYGGQYINDYGFENNIDSLEISGDTASGGLNNGMRQDPWNLWEENCKVDFKVWWFGEVDVWFDKMIVDDVGGNMLFNADNNVASSMDYHIKSESTEENFAGLMYSLRNDKNIRSSNYPSINYVLNKMYDYLHPDAYAQAR